MIIAHLKDLNAKLKGGVLVFDCPGHCDGRIRVPLAPHVEGNRSWQWSGEFPDITLHPSVDAGACCHVNITNGELHQG